MIPEPLIPFSGKDLSRMVETVGICRVCGLEKPLTREHVPPRAALNDDYYYLATFDQMLEAGPEPLKEGPRYQGGIYFEALCKDCNNNYCNRYNRELIRWIHGGEYLLRQLYAAGGDSAEITAQKIYPLRIIKGILAMFLSIKPERFRFEPVGQELARLILDKEAKGLPEGVKVYAYFNHTGNYRYVPFIEKGSVEDFLTGRMNRYSEITKPPFGFVLGIDSEQPDERLCDISQFAEADFRQRVTVSMGLAVLPTHLPFLVCDYRTLDVIEKDERRNIEEAIRQGIDPALI